MYKFVEWCDKETGELRRVIGELEASTDVKLMIRDDFGKMHHVAKQQIIKEMNADQCELCNKWSFTCTRYDAMMVCGSCRMEAERLAGY